MKNIWLEQARSLYVSGKVDHKILHALIKKTKKIKKERKDKDKAMQYAKDL
jgi:hypothetical protein